MRRKTLLLLSFLLVLYIGPMIFISSYGPVTLATEPNLVKDFAPSTEYETSNQSITSFSETLPDDVLFFPDGFPWNTSVSTAGSAIGATVTGDYTDTAADDAVYYKTSRAGPGLLEIVLNFTHGIPMSTDSGNLTIDINHNFGASSDEMVYVWNFTAEKWGSGVDTSAASGYFTLNLTSDNVENGLTRVKANETAGGGGSYLWVDYALSSFSPMTILSNNEFAESFADVSDWGISVGNALTTNGDIGTFTVEGDNAWNIYYCNTPSSNWLNLYLEIRFSANRTGVAFGIVTKTADAYAGSTISAFYPSITASYTTYKILIPNTGVVECVAFIIRHATLPSSLFVDYLRISTANESGLQHDGSTTEGISSADGGTIETDGDLVTLTADGDGSTFLLVADTTATASAISTTYYPFFGIAIDSGSGSWTLEQYDGSAYATLQSSTAISAGTKRFNMKALDTYVSWWRITLTASAVLVSDWAKAYSIANYTITQTGTSTDDVLFTNSSILNCSGTSFTSITLDHDPALSIVTGIDGMWATTTPSGTTEINFYLDAAWLGYTSETSGTFLTGTLTDFRLRFTDNAQIAAVTFLIQIPEWNIINTVILILVVPIDPASLWALNNLYILLGAGLVIGSGAYLVKGGKNEASMNKLFYVIVAFMIGWALIIGGVMP